MKPNILGVRTVYLLMNSYANYIAGPGFAITAVAPGMQLRCSPHSPERRVM